jgi:hypothetical protein
MGGKTAKINQRISPGLRARLNAIHGRHGTNDGGATEDALSAWADYVEASGGYVRPVKMIFDRDAAEALKIAAEGKGGYGLKKKERGPTPV